MKGVLLACLLACLCKLRGILAYLSSLEIINEAGKFDDAGGREGTFRRNVLELEREHKDLLSGRNMTISHSL